MTNAALRVRDYLGHMLDAGSQIQTYTRHRTISEFLSDRLLQDGVVRNIEVLGEASRKILETAPDIAPKFPGIPFAAIYGMRNQPSHGYFSIDLDLVWKVIEQDVPGLRLLLEVAIAELEKPASR